MELNKRKYFDEKQKYVENVMKNVLFDQRRTIAAERIMMAILDKQKRKAKIVNLYPNNESIPKS